MQDPALHQPVSPGTGDAQGEPTQERWKGAFKLVEECGELLQLLGKLGAFPGGHHPDGKGDLAVRLEHECGDVLAALMYFVTHNPELSARAMSKQYDTKLEQFRQWGLTGINGE